MRFLADMGIALRVVAWLREQNHNIVHLRDEGLQKLEDEWIFQKAIQEKLNKDSKQTFNNRYLEAKGVKR